MSSDLNFFLKRNDTYIPIESFSNSSYAYKAGRLIDKSHGKGVELTREDVRDMIDYLMSELKVQESIIELSTDRMATVSGMIGDFKERYEIIIQLGEDKEGAEEEKKFIEDKIQFFSIMLNILDFNHDWLNKSDTKLVMGFDWAPPEFVEM